MTLSNRSFCRYARLLSRHPTRVMLAVSSVCVAAIVASLFLGDVPDFTDPQAVCPFVINSPMICTDMQVLCLLLSEMSGLFSEKSLATNSKAKELHICGNYTKTS